MYLRTLLIVIVLFLLAAFAALNWSVFIASTQLSLGFTSVDAPLGIVLLALCALLTLLFLIYVVYLQSSVLFESRRHTRELQTQRELAEQAEASRFSQLRSFLETEMAKLRDSSVASQTELEAHIERLEREIRVIVEQSGNALAASLGQIEDRLENSNLLTRRSS